MIRFDLKEGGTHVFYLSSSPSSPFFASSSNIKGLYGFVLSFLAALVSEDLPSKSWEIAHWDLASSCALISTGSNTELSTSRLSG